MADENASMKSELGGKGKFSKMTLLKLPVPAGFPLQTKYNARLLA